MTPPAPSPAIDQPEVALGTGCCEIINVAIHYFFSSLSEEILFLLCRVVDVGAAAWSAGYSRQISADVETEHCCDLVFLLQPCLS
jgi:hypothetical protein